MKCPECNTTIKGKVCPCGWRSSPQQDKPKSTNCKTCNVIHREDYLIQGNCHDCHTVSQMAPDDREYYRTLASQYRFKLVDIPTHVMAANRLNQPIEEYLESLPRNRQQFVDYFKDKNVTIGGRKIL